MLHRVYPFYDTENRKGSPLIDYALARNCGLAAIGAGYRHLAEIHRCRHLAGARVWKAAYFDLLASWCARGLPTTTARMLAIGVVAVLVALIALIALVALVAGACGVTWHIRDSKRFVG
jgi:hypothetical protein